MRPLKIILPIAALIVCVGGTATAGKLTKQFLDGTVWEGKFNIQARQSYTAPTTITFTLSPSGKLDGIVKSKFFRTIRTLPATGRITKEGLLIVDFSTAAAQRVLKLKLENNQLNGDANTLVRGFPGSGQASFTKQ
jgi:hypothetical protein